jgi:amidase
MPIGVQFTGPMGNDQRLLELAYELEAAQPWKMIHAFLNASANINAIAAQ